MSIRDSKLIPKRRREFLIRRIEENINSWSVLLFSLSKPISIFSVSVSGLLILSYCIRFRVPTPDLDFRTVFLFASMTFILCVVTTFVSFWAVFPSLAKEAVSKEFKSLFPRLYRDRPDTGPLGLKEIVQYIAEYSLGILIIFSSGVWSSLRFRLDQELLLRLALLATIVTLIASIVIYSRIKSKGHVKLVILIASVASYVWVNLLAVVYILLTWAAEASLAEGVFGATSADIDTFSGVFFGFIAAVLPIYFHLLFSIGPKSNWRHTIIWPGVFFLLIFFIPGASYLGGLSLSILGHGGLIPVRLELTTQASSQVGTTIDGCLYLDVGSQVVIAPNYMLDSRHDERLLMQPPCHLVAAPMSSDAPVTYPALEMIPREQILRIIKFGPT